MWSIDAKAQQDRLESREKKCQEGILRQVPGGSHPATSSTALPQTKGKSISQSTRKALDFSLSTSSPTSSSEAGTNQGSIGSPSIGARPISRRGSVSASLKHFQLHRHLLRGLAQRFLMRSRSWMLLRCRCPLLILLGPGKNWLRILMLRRTLARRKTRPL